MAPEGDCTRLVASGARNGGGPAVVIDEFDRCLDHASTLLVVRREGKHDLTRGKITLGKLHLMEDDGSWARLEHPWERLKWARRHWQRSIGSAETAKAAAESLGMQENTYSAYERRPDSSKHIPMDHAHAAQFGRKFKINWIWLLTGEDTPFPRTPEQNRALQLMAQANPEQQKHAVDLIEVAIRRKSG